MALPTPKQQRESDLKLLYDPDLPWVRMAQVPDVAEEIPVRISFADDDQEGDDVQREIAWIRARASDWPAPEYRGKVTISGQDWHIALITLVSELEWRVKLERNVRVGFAGRM